MSQGGLELPVELAGTQGEARVVLYASGVGRRHRLGGETIADRGCSPFQVLGIDAIGLGPTPDDGARLGQGRLMLALSPKGMHMTQICIGPVTASDEAEAKHERDDG